MNRFLDIGAVGAVWTFDFTETMEVAIEGGMACAERHVETGESFGESRCEFDKGAL